MRIPRTIAILIFAGSLVLGALIGNAISASAATYPKPKIITCRTTEILTANGIYYPAISGPCPVVTLKTVKPPKTAKAKVAKTAKSKSKKSASTADNVPNIPDTWDTINWPVIASPKPDPIPPTMQNVSDNITCMVICT